MANPSLSRITVQRDCSAPATAITLARLAATKAVKRQMAAQGLKVPYVEHRVITAAANVYLHDHFAELIADASALIALPELRKIAEQEQRRRATVR